MLTACNCSRRDSLKSNDALPSVPTGSRHFQGQSASKAMPRPEALKCRIHNKHLYRAFDSIMPPPYYRAHRVGTRCLVVLLFEWQWLARGWRCRTCLFMLNLMNFTKGVIHCRPSMKRGIKCTKACFTHGWVKGIAAHRNLPLHMFAC